MVLIPEAAFIARLSDMLMLTVGPTGRGSELPRVPAAHQSGLRLSSQRCIPVPPCAMRGAASHFRKFR